MHQLNGERQNTHVVLRINVMEHAGNKLIIKKTHARAPVRARARTYCARVRLFFHTQTTAICTSSKILSHTVRGTCYCVYQYAP